MKSILILVFLFFLCYEPSLAMQSPTVLTCESNAKASRDFVSNETADALSTREGWGGDTKNPKVLFGIETKDDPDSEWLRDKVFANLDSDSVVVRSITKPDIAAEFNAKVISRYEDSVFLSWVNDFADPNKVWTAVVNIKEKKVVIAQVFQGMTSVGGEVETLDCK